MVKIDDRDNGGYTYYAGDFTVHEMSSEKIVVSFKAKNTKDSITLTAKFMSIDLSRTDLFVYNMKLESGKTGYIYGLVKDVDLTKQNYYITDVIDVRGIYLNKTLNLDNGVDEWKRYENYSGNAAYNNWIYMTELTEIRDSERISQHITPERGTRAINTYGTRKWVSEIDPEYKLERLYFGPLSADYNTIW